MSDRPVRVRIAPSPTGFLHIGNVRTALFNWLFARQQGGQFIVRVEDTDEKRFVEGAIEQALTSLRWIGLDWDEGPDIGGPYAPYVQSERKAMGLYNPYTEQLLESGKAYMSFVTEDELTEQRAIAESRGIKAFRYRGPERDWSLEQMRAEAATGKPYTVRLKVPLDGTTSFYDAVRKETVTFHNADLYDVVLIKSTGMPVYHMACSIDDHLMEISHVIRAEEWISSTAYHVMIYEAFGWVPPIFVHVPNVLRQDGRGKLSKRKDDVSANRFWERGYMPEAMMNYLALQGWSYDDHTEIMSRDELMERFSLDRVQPSGARWNPDKLRDMNGIYIRKLPVEQVVERILPFMQAAGLVSQQPSEAERANLRDLVPMVHERLEELADAPELLSFFFQKVEYPDPALLIPKQTDAATTVRMLRAAYNTLKAEQVWSMSSLEEALRALAEDLQVKVGQLFGAIRVAVTGRTVAPPLFQTLAALGSETTLARIEAALSALNATVDV